MTGNVAKFGISLLGNQLTANQFHVTSSGLSIACRRLGTLGGTPLVFVHGLSYFSYDWLPVAQALAIDRECVCPDTRGFGDSEWSPLRDYSVPTLAQDLKSVIDACGLDKVVLVGHSMGGRAVSYLAATEPERVRALVLVDYSPENAPEGMRRTAESVAGVPQVFASVEAAMRHFGIDPDTETGNRAKPRYEAYLASAPGGFAIKRDVHFQEQFRHTLATGERPKLGVDMWQVLGQARCPILALRGRSSDMFSSGTVAKMKASNERLAVLEVDGGHNIPGENPGALADEIRQFLTQLES